MAKVIQIIQAMERDGRGTDDSPFRWNVVLYTLDGREIACADYETAKGYSFDPRPLFEEK